MLTVETKESIGDAADSQPPQQLKRLQQQQDELWKHIVVENTTRMMASSYAYTFLFLILTVQLHWMSGNRGNLLLDPDSSQASPTELAQAMLMQSHQYLRDVGIPLLVSTIRRSVEAMLADTITEIDWIKPTQFVTGQDVENLLYHKLPRTIKYGSASTSDANAINTKSTGIHRNWIRFVLPDEQFFDPIWDIGSSPVWDDAQEQVLEVIWYKLLRDAVFDGWKHVFEQKMEGEQQQIATRAPGRSQQQYQRQQPVAKVVAQFKKSSNLLFAQVSTEKRDGQSESSSSWKDSTTLNSLQNLPTVLELGDVSFQPQLQ
jgi:hypothetical protein